MNAILSINLRRRNYSWNRNSNQMSNLSRNSNQTNPNRKNRYRWRTSWKIL